MQEIIPHIGPSGVLDLCVAAGTNEGIFPLIVIVVLGTPPAFIPEGIVVGF